MIDRPRRLITVGGLAPTLLVTLLCLDRPSWLDNLDHAVYDTLVRSAGTHPPSGRIVIVDVDERSLSTFGQWPWRRDVVGHLIDRLRGLGASVVALDVVFAESDRGDRVELDPDTALARRLEEGRVVLGYAFRFDGGRPATTDCVHHQLALAVIEPPGPPDGGPTFSATGAVCNVPGLAEAAGASGFLNAAPDADGILRRVPLLVEFNGRIYPSLALAAAVAASGARPHALQVANVNASTLRLQPSSAATPSRHHSPTTPAIEVPLDGRGNLLVRFRGPKRTFPYISAADVLEDRIATSTVANKLVFVGTTALGTREVVATPLDTLFAGVEVQATVADNLLVHDFIRRPEHGFAVEVQAVIGLGVIATLLAARVGLAWGAAAAVAGIGAVWVASLLLLSSSGAFVSPLFPTVGLASAVATITVAGLRVERRRADRAGREKATSQSLMVQTLLSLTEMRDAETGRHSRRTQQYARVLAEALARHPAYREYLTPERVDLLASLAPLHDIGKVAIPDRLLTKPGELTPDELQEMRRHPEHGRDVIINAERAAGVHDDLTLAIAKDIVYTHHEKWDGTGYPQGLRGPEIPIPGRVMALVDVYDAVLTRRLYDAPRSHEDTVTLIVKGRGTHFDPVVVDTFVTVAPTMFKLSQGA